MSEAAEVAHIETWQLGATEIADRIASGDLSARQVTLDHIARIKEVNPRLNAVVEILDDAVDRATAVDEARDRQDLLPPWAGVPISVKAEIYVEGSPSTGGVLSRRDLVPLCDAPTVERMRLAGAIILARTNMPDLGDRLHTKSSLYGSTLNPWDASLTCGGSSGGDAVALAMGMVPFGLGSDIGGSLRNPATCCGIVSLKPGLGRIPIAYGDKVPVLAEQLMCVQGPMARRIGDLKGALSLLAGPHPQDPSSYLGGPQPAASGAERRVAVVPCPSGGSAAPSVEAAVRAAAEALAGAGYEVEEVDPPDLEEVFATWLAIIEHGDEPEGDETLGLEVDEEIALFRELVFEAAPPSRPDLLAAVMSRNAILRRWLEFFQQYDLILGPVWTTPPWPVGYDVSGSKEAYDVLVRARLTMAANCLGLPAAVVTAAHGGPVPLGVQLIGPPGGEERCLDAAEEVERRIGPAAPLVVMPDPEGSI